MVSLGFAEASKLIGAMKRFAEVLSPGSRSSSCFDSVGWWRRLRSAILLSGVGVARGPRCGCVIVVGPWRVGSGGV